MVDVLGESRDFGLWSAVAAVPDVERGSEGDDGGLTKLLSENLQEEEEIVRVARLNNVACVSRLSRVLPVEVDSVCTVELDHVGNVLSKGLSIGAVLDSGGKVLTAGPATDSNADFAACCMSGLDQALEDVDRIPLGKVEGEIIGRDCKG